MDILLINIGIARRRRLRSCTSSHEIRRVRDSLLASAFQISVLASRATVVDGASFVMMQILHEIRLHLQE